MRPVARLTSMLKDTLEVCRLCTDGTKNACSILYSASARICKELGYKKIQTFILLEESGISLKASGWQKESETNGDSWIGRKNRKRRNDQPTGPKQKWSKILNDDIPKFEI